MRPHGLVVRVIVDKTVSQLSLTKRFGHATAMLRDLGGSVEVSPGYYSVQVF